MERANERRKGKERGRIEKLFYYSISILFFRFFSVIASFSYYCTPHRLSQRIPGTLGCCWFLIFLTLQYAANQSNPIQPNPIRYEYGAGSRQRTEKGRRRLLQEGVLRSCPEQQGVQRDRPGQSAREPKGENKTKQAQLCAVPSVCGRTQFV